MREIKFRVWDIINKRILNYGEIMHLPMWEVFPGTPEQRAFNVMQYTGLKDKHGKEIYEGDLCKSYNGYIKEVVWKDNSWMYKMKVNKKYQGEAYVEIVYSSMGDTSHRNFGDEIIGNIYENPELLEG
ncbi:YopX family protein [Clostridium culturomicium]|uniref:YopX family protein n=1 Tax=Clostridium culturomicium TaxID=1499683 RepID=UPI003857D701